MKKVVANFFGRLAKFFGEEQEIIEQPQEMEQVIPFLIEEHSIAIEPEKFHKVEAIEEKKPNGEAIVKKKQKNKESKNIIAFNPRDIMETMGVPFLALSKNRKTPIIYESPDGTTKVRISCHSEHYVASIYDWDIIQCISGKIQEVINSKKDIPPRNIIIPRHELLKELRKDDGKKARKEIEESLARLKFTGIETTVRNEDYRYKGGFGFIDSWGYTERKDIKEFRITLSDWLYDGICTQGSLLKVHEEYFSIKSGLKKILYRIARKHVGTKNKSWHFSIEDLHKKSGSERELRKFKHDLQKTIYDNDIPGYFMKWIDDNGKIYVRFTNKRKELEEILSQ
jgi:hypothetical protein